MVTVLFLLSIIGDDAPKIAALPAPIVATKPRQGRCENARDQLVREEDARAAMPRSLGEEPLANAYRPVVRYANCDKPLVIAKGVGRQQR